MARPRKSQIPNGLTGIDLTPGCGENSYAAFPWGRDFTCDKGNVNMLGDGEWIDLDRAARFGGVGKRMIQIGLKQGKLESDKGRRDPRAPRRPQRISRRSLLEYFKPKLAK